jgi:hypothetical protein
MLQLPFQCPQRRHLKPLSNRRMTQSKLYTDGPQISGAMLQSSVARVTSHQWFVHPCTSVYTHTHIHTQVKSTVKLSLCLSQHCTMTHEETDVYHHVLNSVRDGGEQSASCHGRFNLDYSPRYPLHRKLGGSPRKGMDALDRENTTPHLHICYLTSWMFVGCAYFLSWTAGRISRI